MFVSSQNYFQFFFCISCRSRIHFSSNGWNLTFVKKITEFHSHLRRFNSYLSFNYFGVQFFFPAIEKSRNKARQVIPRRAIKMDKNFSKMFIVDLSEKLSKLNSFRLIIFCGEAMGFKLVNLHRILSYLRLSCAHSYLSKLFASMFSMMITWLIQRISQEWMIDWIFLQLNYGPIVPKYSWLSD